MELSARFFGKTKLLRAGYDNEDLRPIDGIAPQPILETLNKKHTSGYGRADDAYELGEHPLTFSSLRKPLVEARITNVPGRVLRQSQFLQSLSL
jgi:hypothetical protein